MSLRDAFIEAVDDAVFSATADGVLRIDSDSVAESLEMFAAALEDTGVPAYVNLAKELRGE